MKVEFVKNHTHKGRRYVKGDTLDASDSELVRLVSRGVALKQPKAPAPKKPTPENESLFEETSIGDTDGPATDK